MTEDGTVPSPKRSGAPGRVRRWGLPGLALLLALAAGFGSGWLVRREDGLNATAYATPRLAVIRNHLREAATPYLFMAGDSYAELVPAERPAPCGYDVVNAGVSGIKTGEYREVLREIRFERLPAAALLTIGTNDLLRKHRPSSDANLQRFRSDADALVTGLVATGARVVVAAVPPIPEALAKVFDTGAFALYSDAFRDICARRGCRYVDPYAAARSDLFWRGRPGTSFDGLHLSDLRGAYRSIAPAICGGG